MPCRILIADDNDAWRKRAREALAKAGFEIVAEASTATEAVERFGETKPDLSLVDLVMPVKGGLEAIAEMRRLDPNATVIAAVAEGDDRSAMKALDAGASAILGKPSDAASLLEVVFETLRWTQRR